MLVYILLFILNNVLTLSLIEIKVEAKLVDSIVVPQKSIESLGGMCISIPISRGALTEEEITGSLPYGGIVVSFSGSATVQARLIKNKRLKPISQV